MRRKFSIVSIEQEREICRKNLSGRRAIDLALECGLAQSTICRIIQRQHSLLSVEVRSPSGTASSFPAYFVNGQASHPSQVLSNGKYWNELQSGTHSASFPFVQEKWAAASARPWSSQFIQAASPTFSVEQEREIYRMYRRGESEYDLASRYGVLPSVISFLIQKCHSAENGELNCNAIPRHAVYGQNTNPSHMHPSVLQKGKPCAPGPLAVEGKVRRAAGSLEVFTSSRDQQMTHPSSGKAVEAQLNISSPGSRGLMDLAAETLTEQQNHTQLQHLSSDDVAMMSSHSSAMQGYGCGQANSLLQTSQPSSYLPEAGLFTIHDDLTQHVKQRAGSHDCEKILEKLSNQLIDSIELCEYFGIGALVQIGFLQSESELLVLDDNAWGNRHDDWLESIMNSLPACVLSNTALSKAIKTAVREGNISSRDEFVQKFKSLNLNKAAVTILSKILDPTASKMRGGQRSRILANWFFFSTRKLKLGLESLRFVENLD